jgi:quinol-cytochrome oxidoreductase complex cytochrome b subunit
MLKFVYEPSPARAYESILYLQNNIFFGQLIRNIHHWSGNILLLIVFFHFLRVFFTGAYTGPRCFNWIIGLGLLCSVLFSAFTGYLLPWDQLGFWAITICTTMLEYIPLVGKWLQESIQGGPEMGPAILTSFYAIHTAVMPAIFIILMGFHFWRVRKAKGLVIPRSPEEPPSEKGTDLFLAQKKNQKKNKSVPFSVSSVPNLLIREVAVGLAVIAFVLVFSMLFDAPLADKANPGLSPNPTKAPWYFLGIQELLMHFHPIYSLLIIPVLTSLFLLAVPYFNYQEEVSGVWFISQKGRKLAMASAVISVLLTALGIVVLEFVFDFNALLPALPDAISNGLIPFILDMIVLAGLYVLAKKKFSASNQEMVQAIFVFLITSFVVLTIVGVWFRGAGMKLVFPW